MKAELLLVNADVRTMDTARPRAREVAMAGGRVLAVGDDLSHLRGPGTRVIDAGGRLVLPGLLDAHTHLLDGGVHLVTAVPLFEVRTVEALLAALTAHAARSELPLVLGTGWQPGTFGDHNLTAAVLDRAVADRPCLIYDSSFHNACLNSAGIAAVGLEDDTPDPPAGHFVRDAGGRATGMLHERAADWARQRLPDIESAALAPGLRAGMAHANALGLTGVIDAMVDAPLRATYAAAAAEQGAMSLRVSGAMRIPVEEDPGAAVERLCDWRAEARGDTFRLNAAKFFLDGVFENRTAAMLLPYADPPGGNAPLMFSPGQIARLFPALDALRFQIHVHAIGDLAARAALDGIAAARAANGDWPARHQIAHLQVMHPDDFPRLQALGVMANIQPLWARYDPWITDVALDMIGKDREPLTYAFRRMLDAGAEIAMGSDWPVTTLSPWDIIETAVTRQAPHREGPREVFHPAECLTVAEAVAGYTLGAAAACWTDGFTGRLRPGYSADLIVLDRDIFACPPHEISATQVLLTLFRGREVHRAAGFDR